MKTHIPAHEPRRLDLIEAGIDMLSDHEAGRFYLTLAGTEKIHAGPFDSEREAMEWLDDMNAFDRANASGWPERRQGR